MKRDPRRRMIMRWVAQIIRVLALAAPLGLTVQGKRRRLVMGRSAEALPAFLTHCRGFLKSQ